MKHDRTWLVTLTVLASCTFGEPEGSALDLFDPPVDAALRKPDGETDESIDPSVTDDGASPPLASETGDAGSGGSSAGGGQCSPMINGCNPVQQTGCLDFFGQQCVVDPESAQPAGRCVFGDLTAQDAGTCAEDFLRTTCKPGSGCHGGACRTLCTCDSQCESGSCCSGAATKASNALKYCEPCS